MGKTNVSGGGYGETNHQRGNKIEEGNVGLGGKAITFGDMRGPGGRVEDS